MPVFARGTAIPAASEGLRDAGTGSRRADVHAGRRRTPGPPGTRGRAPSWTARRPRQCAGAGEVNAGTANPLPEMADLAERFAAWLHVDGAFGLFAALSDRTRHLATGSSARTPHADGHKWLNVPYDCGFAFVRDASLQGGVTPGAAYLPDPLDPSSRRGGTSAGDVAPGPCVRRVGDAPGRTPQRLPCLSWNGISTSGSTWPRGWTRRRTSSSADVPLNIVCFRYRPPGRRRGSARRPEPGDRRGGDPGRARVLRDHGVRREGGVPAGARELAQPAGGRRDDVEVVREVGAIAGER